MPLPGEAGRFIIGRLGRQVQELASVVVSIASRHIDSALNGASSVHHASPIKRWNARSEPLLVIQIEDVHLISLSSLALHASAACDNDHALCDYAHSEMNELVAIIMHGLKLGHFHPVLVGRVRKLCHENWLAMFEVVERVSSHDGCSILSKPVGIFNPLALILLSRRFYHKQAVLELVAR